MLLKRSSTISSRIENKGVIVLFGPTAVGKTSLISKLFPEGAEIISADALQVYRQLNIGTAKPDTTIISRIPHHLIDIIDYTEKFNVGDFCTLADKAINEIIARGNLPVISGGTAYYLKSWLFGMPDTPPSDPGIRVALEARWLGEGDEKIRDELQKVDPVSASRIGRNDRYRMLRALEIHAQTGRALSSFILSNHMRNDYSILIIGLRRRRDELYNRINQRIDTMFHEGLAEEVASLMNAGATAEHPGMKAIGYREWFKWAGEQPPDRLTIKELIARNTRRYAKRQITFFSSLPDVHWFDLSGTSRIPKKLVTLMNDFLQGMTVWVT